MLIHMRQFERAVIGDAINATGTEQMMRDQACRLSLSTPAVRSRIRMMKTGRA
jgi:hypothetical protein